MPTPVLGPFDSAWLKWGRAVQHGQTLQADIFKVANERNADLVTTKAQYDAKGHGFRLIVTDVPPIPPSWALILGDAANNYRSALDHLAWALVERGRTPPATLSERERRRVWFPICDSRTGFSSALKNNLPGVRRADVAILRRYQPYQVAQGRRSRDPIGMLQGINNDDKHRTVRPLWAFPFGVELEVTEERDCTVTRIPRRWRTQLLDVDTELGRIPARRKALTAEPHIEVKHFFSLQPALTHGIGVNEWLTRIYGRTGSLLREFSDPPIDLVASAIQLP